MTFVKQHPWLVSIFVAGIMILTPVLSLGDDIREVPSGFDGVSWRRVVPLNKATLVQFDPDGYVDDFAYLAAVPASVFYDANKDKIFANPLMFYEEEKEFSEEELSLNARQGLDYFMEDWLTYNDDTLRTIEYINVVDEPWAATNSSHIYSNDIYELATQIALNDWSYSDNAVVAVADTVSFGNYSRVENIVEGSLFTRDIKKSTLSGIKQDSIAPQYNDFYVSPEYKYVKANLYWPSVAWLPTLMPLITLGLLMGGLSVPAADPDLQLYCTYENELMMVSASQKWNIREGPGEETGSYVYSPGKWMAAIEDIPTKGLFGERSGTIYQRLMDILTNKVTYYIDVNLYPGEEITLPDTPPFMTRDANFELSWTGNGKLGLIIVDENNVAVGQAVYDNVSKQILHLDQLGEGVYRAIIVQLTEGTMDTISYTLQYSWEQKLTRDQGNYLMNAAEGAVIASLMNAPLLYVTPDTIPACTKEAVEKLGVDNIYVVDLDGNVTAGLDFSQLATVKTRYTDLVTMYQDIRALTHENDVVFTTLDPWSYWLLEELKPEGEKQGALYLGPAAYTAAHHGSPLIAVDMHRELSTAVVWYNEWWKLHAIRDIIPPIAEMYLCGSAVYDFLDDVGLDEPGKVESFITVAGQFDIGTPWDRTFAGPAYAGRIQGTPVDTSYWTCRNIFYPAVIYANPALDPGGIALINGSKSKRMPSGRLQIIKPSEEETFQYPVLNSWITYSHRWNERAGEYWGTTYVTPTGITPFFDPSTNPIDNDVMAKYGLYGSFYPDMSESEVTPFYLQKSGYDIAYSTNFTATIENLNRGVISWSEVTHGWHGDTGSMAFWNPYGVPGWLGVNVSLPTIDENPWRGYELYLPGWLDGSTEEPDVLSQSKLIGLDIVPAKLIEIPIIGDLLFGRRAGYDGIIISILFGRLRTTDYTGLDFDNALENVHSAGFTGGSCLIANTYLHLILMRHGFVYQLIDPWETSWYSAFGTQMVARGQALGSSIGKAYTEGMLTVGVGYLTKQWWWDVKENICLFGDPDLVEWSPQHRWEEPAYISAGAINGHEPFGPTDYPQESGDASMGLYIAIMLVIVFAATGGYLGRKWQRRRLKQKTSQ